MGRRRGRRPRPRLAPRPGAARGVGRRSEPRGARPRRPAGRRLAARRADDRRGHRRHGGRASAAASAAGRAISDEHFGTNLTYADGDPALVEPASASMVGDRRDVLAADAEQLRNLVGRWVDAGFSKFVVRPLRPGDRSVRSAGWPMPSWTCRRDRVRRRRSATRPAGARGAGRARRPETHHVPDLAWGVVLDGRLALTGAAGGSDDGRRRPSSRTVFRIASMTKSVHRGDGAPVARRRRAGAGRPAARGADAPDGRFAADHVASPPVDAVRADRGRPVGGPPPRHRRRPSSTTSSPAPASPARPAPPSSTPTSATARSAGPSSGSPAAGCRTWWTSSCSAPLGLGATRPGCGRPTTTGPVRTASRTAGRRRRRAAG